MMAKPVVPDWLTADFLKSCLQSDKENYGEISITRLTFEPAVPAGINYGSNMFRAKIQYKTLQDKSADHSTSLIIKTMLVGALKEDIEECITNIFLKEPKYYTEFISEAYKLCKFDIVPKHYTPSNPFCVILEDLKLSGFEMVDRHKLLDFNHCQLYVKASSKLHALSIAVHKKNPELIEALGLENEEVATKTSQIFKVTTKRGFQCMAAYLEDKEKYKEQMDIIKEISESEDFWNIYMEKEKSHKPMRALIQKDPWCTNMMFKYDASGNVISVKLLDFQYLKFTWPAEELMSFIMVSANDEVKETKLDDLYHLYCDSLNKNLQELGCSERLSFENLKRDIVQMSSTVMTFASTIAPICLSDEAVNFNEVFDPDDLKVPIEDSSFYKLYQGRSFTKHYPKIVDFLTREGIFNHIKEQIKKFKLEK